jgi:hypothetical protein
MVPNSRFRRVRARCDSPRPPPSRKRQNRTRHYRVFRPKRKRAFCEGNGRGEGLGLLDWKSRASVVAARPNRWRLSRRCRNSFHRMRTRAKYGSPAPAARQFRGWPQSAQICRRRFAKFCLVANRHHLICVLPSQRPTNSHGYWSGLGRLSQVFEGLVAGARFFRFRKNPPAASLFLLAHAKGRHDA